MQALILAGGQGTRLRPLTNNTPKPIVPIGNQPFLLRQIQSLKNAGVTDITLSTGYQPYAIEKALGDGSEYGVQLRYLVEPQPMGTAGGYKFAEKFLKSRTIVLNGDILTDIDIRTVTERHANLEATATIVLTAVENPSAYGVVEVGENDRVLRFLEKPKPGETSINTINAGIYILEPEVLGLIPTGENYSFEYQLFPSLLERKEKFHAFVSSNDYWLDIGTPQRYLQAHYDLMIGKVKDFQNECSRDFQTSGSAQIDGNSWIADGVVVKDGAKIENSILGKGITVGEEAVVRDSVIWAGTNINSRAKISGSIIGWDSYIGKNVTVNDGSVLGDKTILPDFSDN